MTQRFFQQMRHFARIGGLVLASSVCALAQTPPVRPAAPATPAKTAPTPASTPAKAEAPPSIEKVNAYFNAMKGLQADFMQITPDGRSFTGILYISRPGKMRFEYDPPATLEVVADGRSVAIIDRKLKTQDVYFINQTPLKFLLQAKIDVAKDSKVLGISRDGAHILLQLEDKSTLGGTSQIRVMFDGTTYALKEWTVIDPQGMETRVALSKLDPTANPKPSLFVINEEKILNPN